jgi:hypothetical protein
MATEIFCLFPNRRHGRQGVIVYDDDLSVSQRPSMGIPGIIPFRTGTVWAKNLFLVIPN